MRTFEFKNVTVHKYKEMREWCMNHLGKTAWYVSQLDDPSTEFKWYALGEDYRESSWGRQSYRGDVYFAFKNDKDATMFALLFL